MDVKKILASLDEKHPGEPLFKQAVEEVLETIKDYVEEHPQYEAANIIERIIEPDRIFTFKVEWVDDKGKIQVNTGYRVQFNNAIGPYKGGVRFHPSVKLDTLKFLGFEQT
ncbi:MAG: Glu/Leu/Phe/Val dehydrogenase dimerization domain-containing protein, partial [Bacteroidales bacterium]